MSVSHLLRYRFSALYLLMIPLVNWAFGQPWHYFDMPDGNKWSPFSIVVGLVLVVRDFAQREIGHYVFIPLLIGVVISYFMAPPQIAIASGLAFLLSECIDWLIFTFTRARFSTRIIASSIIGSVVDTLVFLAGASRVVPGILSPLMILTMLLSKFFGAIVVFIWIRKRERKATPRLS